MALKTSLVALWELNGDGNDSHSTNNLTAVNSPGYVSGQYSQNAARLASASSKAFTIADNAALSMDDETFSLAAWVRITASSGEQRFISKYDYNSDNREYSLALNVGSSNRINFIVSNDGGGGLTRVDADSYGAPSVDGSTWVWVYAYHEQGVGIGISVNNGTIDTNTHTGGVHQGTSPFDIGRMYDIRYIDADIQQVAVWRKLLDAGDRTAIYNGGAGLAYSAWDASTGQPASRRMGGVKFSRNQSLGLNRW